MIALGGGSGAAGKLRWITLVGELGVAGGAERMAMQIAIRLDPDRFERTLCVTRWPPDHYYPAEALAAAQDQLREAGVRFFPLERNSRWSIGAWRPLYALLRRERVDVLHAHQFGANVWGTVLGRLAGVPVVVAHDHTWSFEGDPVRRFVDRNLIARGSSIFVAVTAENRRQMIEREGIRPADIVVVPNGIPPPEHRSWSDVRAELGLSPKDPVIGTVTGLRREKGLDVLMRSALMMKSEFPRLRVLIAGAGPDHDRLAALVRELDLQETVDLLGLRRDIPAVLAALDVAVNSSHWEGSPLSVMEYMEAAKPVVATRVGGVPDLIEDGAQGVLVPPGDPAALAEAIARMLRDPQWSAEMGRRGQARRRQEFDISVTVHALERLYGTLYARSRRCRSRPALTARPD